MQSTSIRSPSIYQKTISSTAAPSFKLNLKPIKAGKKKTRFILFEKDKFDSSFFIAGRCLSPSSPRLDVIVTLMREFFRLDMEVRTDDRRYRVFLNRNSLSNRLHIYGLFPDLPNRVVSQQKLIETIKRRGLSPKFIVDNYRKIASQFKFSNSERVKVSHFLQCPTSHSTSYMHIVGRKGNLTINAHLGWNSEKEKVEMFVMGKKILKGSSFYVYDIEDTLDQTASFVAKKPIETVSAITVELVTLRFFNLDGPRWGIQAPYRCINLNEDVQHPFRTRQIAIVKKYNIGDLIDLYDLVNQKNSCKTRAGALTKTYLLDRYFEFHQLLGGLYQIVLLGYVHLDIKPANILAEKRNGNIYVYISDWEGALTNRQLRFESIKITPKYALRTESELVISACEPLPIAQAMDVFSMGICLQRMLTGEHPYTCFGVKKYILAESYVPIKEELNVPEPLVDLIQEMQDPDYEKRLTAEQAFKRFDDFLRVESPETYKKIYKIIDKDFVGTQLPTLKEKDDVKERKRNEI